MPGLSVSSKINLLLNENRNQRFHAPQIGWSLVGVIGRLLANMYTRTCMYIYATKYLYKHV